MTIHSKLPYMGKHIFSSMTELAIKHNAINLSQGFPDFEPSPQLQELLVECLKDKTPPYINQYAPAIGIPLLRQQVAKQFNDYWNIPVNPETEVTVGVGATEMIFDIIATLVYPGDEVIIVEPCYDSYRPSINIVGGKAVAYKLPFPDYKIDWNAFGKLITKKTKLICLSSPNNPTGTLLSEDDWLQLATLVKDTDILIMSDEVYAHMVYDGKKHVSPLSIPELRKRCFSVFSFGKTYHITGWRIGYCVANEVLTAELRKVHQNTVYGASHPLQKAIALHMQQSDDYLDLATFFQKKRDLFIEVTKGSRFRPLSCNGAYFQLFDYSAISKENDVDFCKKLAEEHKVAAIPVSQLYSDKEDNCVVRFCFAKTDEILVAAGEKLSKV